MSMRVRKILSIGGRSPFRKRNESTSLTKIEDQQGHKHDCNHVKTSVNNDINAQKSCHDVTTPMETQLHLLLVISF